MLPYPFVERYAGSLKCVKGTELIRRCNRFSALHFVLTAQFKVLMQFAGTHLTDGLITQHRAGLSGDVAGKERT